jgi:dolichyl-diphosphooligosaccharide--protein glycosyltransferase
VYQFIRFARKFVSKERIEKLFRVALVGLSIALGAGFILLLLLGQTKWSGRSMTLLDPTYAKKYIPIVASVSEHQATTWSSYFFDIHFAIFFTPVGLYYIFHNRKYNIVFMGIYAALSVYFASVMIRLLLVFAPAACICAAIGVSWLFEVCAGSVIGALSRGDKQKEKKKTLPVEVAIGLILILCYFMSTFVFHGVMAGAEAYSSPSVVLSSKYRGQRYIIDDYR